MLPRPAALRGWLSAGLIYGGGVTNRASLGIASIAATHRFGLSPAQLSTFVVLQLGIYAAMQIPTGVLVDRFGPRRLLLAAASLMGIAGFTFAFAPNYPTALLGRVILGLGDSLSYVSVLRFAGRNFSRRVFPQVVALTAMFAIVATVLATVPLALLLHVAGWELTFSVIALLPLVGGIAAIFAVPAEGKSSSKSPSRRATLAATVHSVRSTWRVPGTRLGFWLHFTNMSITNTFGILWGLPYLVAMGFSKTTSGYVLLMTVLIGAAASLIIGAVLVRRPSLRVPMAVANAVATLLLWIPLLAAGGDHPHAALVVPLVAVMSLGGPVALIAFLLARTYNSSETAGTATGVINGAGFVSTIVCSALIGGVLDLVGSSGPGAFRMAYLVALAVPAVGLSRMLVWWRRLRAEMLARTEAGEPIPLPVVRRPWDAPGWQPRTGKASES